MRPGRSWSEQSWPRGGDALLTGDGGVLTTIADPTTFAWLCCRASISDDGTVAFPGAVVGGGESIFAEGRRRTLRIILPEHRSAKPRPASSRPSTRPASSCSARASQESASACTRQWGRATLIVATAPSGGFIDFGIRPAIAAGRGPSRKCSLRHPRHLHEPRWFPPPRSPTTRRSFTTSSSPPSIRSRGVAFVAGLVGGDVANLCRLAPRG